MIKYSLICQTGHEFEAWFASIASFDEQKQNGWVVCPSCGTHDVDKAVMAPSIKKPVPQDGGSPTIANTPELLPEPLRQFINGWREHISKNYDYVGDNFAKEARAIHEGDSDPRSIYGETTIKEARDLVEDGIEIAPLPPMANPKGDKGIN